MNESVKMHAKRCALQGIITSFIKMRNSDMATSKNIIPHVSLSTLIADKLRPSFPYKLAIYLTIQKSKLDLIKEFIHVFNIYKYNDSEHYKSQKASFCTLMRCISNYRHKYSISKVSITFPISL